MQTLMWFNIEILLGAMYTLVPEMAIRVQSRLDGFLFKVFQEKLLFYLTREESCRVLILAFPCFTYKEQQLPFQPVPLLSCHSCHKYMLSLSLSLQAKLFSPLCIGTTGGW